jgi:hypothetical protein
MCGREPRRALAFSDLCRRALAKTWAGSHGLRAKGTVLPRVIEEIHFALSHRMQNSLPECLCCWRRYWLCTAPWVPFFAFARCCWSQPYTIYLAGLWICNLTTKHAFRNWPHRGFTLEGHFLTDELHGTVVIKQDYSMTAHNSSIWGPDPRINPLQKEFSMFHKNNIKVLA